MEYLKIDVETTNFLYCPNEVETLETHIVRFINHHINRLGNKKIDVLVLGLWCEEYNDNQLQTIQDSINVIKEHFSFEIVLLLGEQYRRVRYDDINKSTRQFYNADVYYIWAFPYRFYVKIFEQKLCEPSDTYQQHTINKFLLLVGKPNRIHRIRLLYKLYKKDLLKYCLWRFNIHNEYIRNECRRLLYDISDEEFDRFVDDCEQDLDNVVMNYHPDSSHYPGIPFERWIWDTTAFQVIPETDFCNNFPSEKTWLAFMNKTPFIMLAQIHHNEKLRELGFRTFEKYLVHDSYNDVDNDNLEGRLDEIVENIECWVHNIDKFYEEIKVDVEHNFQTFMKLVKQEEDIILSIINKYNLDCKPSDLVVGYYE